MSPVQATVYLGLGANLGNRERNITRAVEILGEKVNVDQVSAIYESPAMYVTGQPAFLNAVCRGATELEPLELLAFAQEIERYMGRAGGERNAARPLDVDILFYGGLVTETPKLTIPHPLIDERPFVLAPLAEIDPYLRHPVTGKSASEMLEALGGPGETVPFDAEEAYWKGLKRGRRPIPLRDNEG